MNPRLWRRGILSSLPLFLGFLLAQCAGPKEELDTYGETEPMRMFPPNHVFPLSEINLEKAFEDCRGMRVLEENATTVRDCYRGGVQEKEEGERLFQQGPWGEAEDHFKKSNNYLKVVTEFLPEDEPYRNVYGDHVGIFLPNLIMADNQLKLARIYGKTNRQEDIYWTVGQGQQDLSQFLQSAKTEWALKIKKEFEEELAKK